MNEANRTPRAIGAVVISAVLIIGAYVVLAQNAEEEAADTSTVTVTTQVSTETPSTEQTETAPAEDTTTPAETETATEQTPANNYLNGTYSASGVYRVPGGDREDISLQITIENDNVTALTVDTVATNGESAEYQAPFDAQINGEVIGQDIDDADVFSLGGASLTSAAFNDLLDAVRNEARS